MPITPYHLVLNYFAYLFKFREGYQKYYKYLLAIFASNIIDLDHFFRFFYEKSVFTQEYGLDNLLLHGWWCILPISILIMQKNEILKWFGFGWALHIVFDGLMVYFGLNYLLLPI